MKKFSKLFLFMLMLPLASVLVACGGGENNQTDATAYKVTAEESEFYNVNGQTTKATAGTQAYVKIVPEFDAVVIEKVLFNGQECTKSLDVENRYDFVMPAENVTITVEYSFLDNETDNFLGWNEDNVYTLVPCQEGEYNNIATLSVDLIKNPSGSGGYFSSHDEKVFSLNQDVVPDSALSVKAIINDGTIVDGFSVKIDRTKISAGSAQIVLVVDNGHKFGDSSLLVCTLTIEDKQ